VRVDASYALAYFVLEGMNDILPVRTRPQPASALALVTVLALLLAPVCAPLCAARNCSAGAAKDQCHETAPAAAQHDLLTPHKICGNTDFSALLTNQDEQASFQRDARSIAASPVSLSAEREAAASPILLVRWGEHLVPIAPPSSLLLTTTLRI
jgi:hypothetical protein